MKFKVILALISVYISIPFFQNLITKFPNTMSPSQLHANNRNTTNNLGFCPPPLKINRNSHSIKKSSSLSSSSSSSSMATARPPQQQRHPVIIYTHSPKVIHTHPRDFMALVQKLTGLSRPEDDGVNDPTKSESGNNSSSSPAPPPAEDNKISSKVVANNDDNESSSVITEEYSSSNCNLGDGQVNSSSAHHQPHLCNVTNNIPVFASNSADFYGSINQPFYSYNDSFLFSGMRTPVPSSSSALMLEGLNEFREY